MTILILHGITGRAGIHWQQWLHDELVKLGHQVIMPTLPNPDHPDRSVCLATVQNLLKNVALPELVIVGHSLGVATALDFLEISPAPIKALFSVSGFYEDYGAELNSYFMREKTIDISKVRSNISQAQVFYGDDDPYVPQETLAHLATALRVEPVIINKGGHLNARAGFTTFPQLLESIVQLS